MKAQAICELNHALWRVSEASQCYISTLFKIFHLSLSANCFCIYTITYSGRDECDSNYI